MKVLVIGGGGREHALAWKAKQSPLVNHVYVAPGNAGTAVESGISNVDIGAEDLQGLLKFAIDNHIELTIVGPEVPLVKGVVDLFSENGLKCFGPTADAAQLEGSKTFSKEFLVRHSIHTARYESFTEPDEALEFSRNLGFPQVIKADGLAAGKGVVIADSMDMAGSAIRDMLSGNSFGEAGHRVVIEEFLQGEEASFICMVDGIDVLPMASSQDHKAAYDGDVGPNTGGMGAYSPAHVIDSIMHKKIMDEVIRPTVQGLAKDGIRFTGFLYAGLMIGIDGIPKVLEFNCRFGDPETQPIMMRMQSDLVSHCLAAVNGKLADESVSWDPRIALGIVLAADGYPGVYPKGQVIKGLNSSKSGSVSDGVVMKVFHAGTRLEDEKMVTAGGRVLCVTGLGNDIRSVRQAAYEQAEKIHWDGCWYRTDIGHRAMQRD